MLALVLSGGGARAAYQVGVLLEIAERMPDLRFDVLTGASAGAINAVFLACHRGGLPEAAAGLEATWRGLTVEHTFRSDMPALTASALRWLAAIGSGGGPLAPEVRALVDTTPLRAYLKRVLPFDGLEANLGSRRLTALAVNALNYTTGETVSFIHGREGVEPWERWQRRGLLSEIDLDHVMASSAIPLVFPPVRIGEQWFGDGAVRDTTPLAPAVHLGADRILAVALRTPRLPEPSLSREGPSPAQILGLLLNAVFTSNLDADAERLERINRLVDLLPASSKADALRHVRLHVVHPSQHVSELVEGLERRMPRGLQMIARGLGARRTKSRDFLSYVMFTEPYVRRLIDLGRRDVSDRWPALRAFLLARDTA